MEEPWGCAVNLQHLVFMMAVMRPGTDFEAEFVETTDQLIVTATHSNKKVTVKIHRNDYDNLKPQTSFAKLIVERVDEAGLPRSGP